MKHIKDLCETEYCKCDKNTAVYSESNDFGYWLVCSECEKVVEDSFTYFDHYDGEDHALDF